MRFLENKPSVSLNEALSYLAEFPEMIPQMTCTEDRNLVVYMVKWSEDARRFLGAIDSLNQTAEVKIPRRYDNGNNRGRLGGTDFVAGLDIAEQLSDLFVPSQNILSFLLDWQISPMAIWLFFPYLRNSARMHWKSIRWMKKPKT